MSKNLYSMRARRGWWIFRQEWVALCSKHRLPLHNCPECEVGLWRFVLVSRFESWLWHNHLTTFLWWSKRPWNPWLKIAKKTFPQWFRL